MTASRTTVQIEPMILPRVVRNPTAGPGRRNEDNLVARPGSSAASRRSISASIRCSSIDSAIAPYLRVPRADGNSSNYPPRGELYPIVLTLCLTLFATGKERLPNAFPQKTRRDHGHWNRPRPNVCLPSSNAGSRMSTMRWDSLLLDSSDAPDPAGGSTLPLIERSAVARTFDTPEFRGMTFYEVHAKSIVSEVPKSSRMMFRYTINPYRGCSHACRYCLPGETPILMADGTAKPLAAVRVGDAIYGTVRDGYYRR